MHYETRKSARARRLRITVYPEGRVVVTIPRRVSEDTARDFVARRAQWIERALSRNRDARPLKTSREEFTAHKEAARTFIESRVAALNAAYKFDYTRITVRNQKTLWGSCSRSRVLSFNYALAKLPLPLADYVVVHELCHLKEHNHASRFWKLVEQTIPNHRALRAQLRRYRLGLVEKGSGTFLERKREKGKGT